MRVFVGTDHAGLEFKDHLKQALADAGHEPVDCGAFSTTPQDDYPPFCFAVGERTVAEPGTSASSSAARATASRSRRTRCPACARRWSGTTDTAQLARQHNDANVVSIGARQHSVEEATGWCSSSCATPFSGEERHVRRIGLVTDYERDRHRPAGGLPTR